MKKEYGKYIAIILGIICIILGITLIFIKVSKANAQSEDSNLKGKIAEEISYIDSNIIDIMNKLNNISVVKYKVYTKEINEPEDNSSSSSQSSSQDSQNQSSGNEQNSGQEENGQNNSSENQNTSSGNPTTISELVPDTTLNQNQQEPDWTQISFLMENIYSTWPTVNLDLQKQGISNELISNFSLSMDGVVQSIKNKDKNNTLINLFNMYLNIPKYSSSISEDGNKQNLYNTKLYILNAYVIASTSDKWNDVTSSISSAKDYFSKIVSSENENENKKKAFQKAYVVIEDLERMSQMNDINIFYMEYKNVMQELDTIQI